MNNVILIGRLTSDPELRFLPGNGRAVARFSLAVDRGLSKEKRMELEQQGKPTADFPRITVWGRAAENCANYLSKGKQVAIQGRIQTGSYNNAQGQRVYTTDVVADRVEFIEWGDSNRSSNNNNSNNNNNTNNNNNDNKKDTNKTNKDNTNNNFDEIKMCINISLIELNDPEILKNIKFIADSYSINNSLIYLT